jgi:putative Ca2+/H+ antiporter (TMEM165/GDT1 family)
MDFKLFAASFVAIFLAELGDKTQLATLSLAAAGGGSRWTVFLGSALALVCASAMAVIGGEFVAKYVPPIVITRAAGTLFVTLGLVMLVRSWL